MVGTRLRAFEWAGCRVAIEHGPAWDWRWPEGFGGHVSAPDSPDVHVSLAASDSPVRVEEGLSYVHEGALIEVGRAGGDPLIACSDGRLARFDRSFRFASVTAPTSLARRGTFPLARPLDDLIVIHRSLAAGALAIWGSASVRDGRALTILGDHAVHEPARDSSTWSGWLVIEPDVGGVRVAPLPSTRVSGAPSPSSAQLIGLHLLDAMGGDPSPATTLDAEAGAAEILRFAFAPLASAVPPESVIGMAAELAERVTIVRLAGAGPGFSWQRSRSPLGFAPPAGA